MNLTDNGGEFAGKKTGMTYTLNVRFFLAAGQHYMVLIMNETYPLSTSANQKQVNGMLAETFKIDQSEYTISHSYQGWE